MELNTVLVQKRIKRHACESPPGNVNEGVIPTKHDLMKLEKHIQVEFLVVS